MTVAFKPVRLAIDDEARLVERDGRLLGIVTLHDAGEIGAQVHVEVYFGGDAPDTFKSLDEMAAWIDGAHRTAGRS